MIKSVSLARGLKEKNRLAGKLKELREGISSNNSCGEESPRDIDVRKTLDEVSRIQERLLQVRTALALANQGIVEKIIGLEELKSEIAWLKELNTTSRTEKEYHGAMETLRKVEAVVTGPEKIKMVNDLQVKANRIQDELDDYNASHRITIEIDD